MNIMIKTQRLIIKPMSENDISKLSELLTNDRISKTYILPDFKTYEEIEKMVRFFINVSNSDNHFTRGVYLNDNIIGWVNDVKITKNEIEVGYVISPEYWNCGYATEMLSTVIEELFKMGYKKIIAGAFSENIASINVMKKCNMTKLPKTEAYTYRGKEHICVYYEIKRQQLIK